MKKLVLLSLFGFLISITSYAQKHIKLMNKGVELLQNGNYAQAIDYFNKSIAKKSDYYLAYFNRAVAYYDMGDSAKMKLDLDKSLSLSPNNYDCLELYARHHYRAGNQSAALKWSNQALKVNPAGYIALLISGEIYAIQNKFEEAEKRIEKAYKLADEPCRVAPYLGSIKTILNKEIEAKSYFDQCRNSVFYTEDYKMREALYHYTFGNDEQAKKLIEGIDPQGIKNKVFVSIFYFYEGNAALEKENYLRAISLYNISQQYGSKDEPEPATYLNRSICYMNIAEYGNALSDINTYLTFKQNDTAYRNRAYIYEKMGKQKESNWSIHQAIEYAPNDEQLYLTSSNKFVLFEQWDSATKIIEKGIVNNPKAGVLYYQKAYLTEDDITYKDYMNLIDSCLKYDMSVEQAVQAKMMYYLETDQLKSANTLLLKALSLGLDTSSYYFNKAILYMEQEKEVQAIKLFEKSLDYDSFNSEALFVMGMYYQEEKQYDKAIQCNERLLSIAKTEGQKGMIYRALGKIYTLMKDSNKACEYYKKAQSMGQIIPQTMFKLNNCKTE